MDNSTAERREAAQAMGGVPVLPKADLHLHQEVWPRLDRLVASRQGRAPRDWSANADRVVADVPPGVARLGAIYRPDAELARELASAASGDDFVVVVEAILDEAAVDGAVLVEVRFGPGGPAAAVPELMPRLREAERRVRRRHPRLRAEAIAYVLLRDDPEHLRAAEWRLEACLEAASAGLGGIDLSHEPYDTELDPAVWAVARRWTARAEAVGLGVTAHAGEFSTANCGAVLRLPGLRRIGHGVHYAGDPRRLADLVASGATVECCPTCNVVLGAVPSYPAHPIRRLADAGVPVTLNTDLPLHVGTSIGREYATAAALGFSPAELLSLTLNAVRASFAPAARRDELRAELERTAV